MHIVKGMIVKVISGNHKGQSGKVLDAFPKTIRSINELVPNLLAPCTDTQAASPTANNPSQILSGLSSVGLKTSVL